MVSLSHTKHRLVVRKGSGAASEEARQVPNPECPFWSKGWGASAGSGGREAPPPFSPEHHLLCRGSESGNQVDLRAPHPTQLRLSLSLPQASHPFPIWACSAAGPWLCQTLLQPTLTLQIHLCSGIKDPMYEQSTCHRTSNILLSASKLIPYLSRGVFSSPGLAV